MSSDNTSSKSKRDNISGLPVAVLLPKPRSKTTQQPSTPTPTPTMNQPISNNNSIFNDELLKSLKQCIETALEPLNQRITDIEKAMFDRTSSIAAQVSTVSINQQTLHDNLLIIIDKLDELQFEDQSIYTTESNQSLSSLGIPSKRSSNKNTDNLSTCSTETSESLSNFELPEEASSINEEEDEYESVNTEPSKTMFNFRLSKAASFSSRFNRNDELSRTESSKTTVNSHVSDVISPYTNQVDTARVLDVPHEDKQVNQTKQNKQTKQAMRVSDPVPVSTPAPLQVQAPAPVAAPVPTSALVSVTHLISATPPTTDTAAAIETPPQVSLFREENRSSRRSRTPKCKNFTYIYLNLRYRQLNREIRSKLRIIGLSSNKIIDINYPVSKVIAILLPDDYLKEAIDILKTHDIPILLDFDPLDPKNLGDPKFKNLPLEERTELIRRFHTNQMQKALNNMKDAVKFDVALGFEKKGWIDEETVRKIALESSAVPKSKPNRNRGGRS